MSPAIPGRSTPGARARLAGPRAAIAACTLLAFALRAHRLAAQSLWSDEDITLDRARQGLLELLSGLPVEHGPLYFVLVHGWTRLAGDGDLALRFPSLLAGVVSVPLIAYVGRRLVGPTAGLVAGLLAAVNPFLVWYGQEARMYALVGALGLAAVAAALRAERLGSPAWWGAAGACVALGTYAHYYAALLGFVLAAWAAADVARKGRRAARGWLVAGGTALLLFAPWVPRAVGVTAFTGWRQPTPLWQVPWALVEAWSAGAASTVTGNGWIGGLYAVLVGAGLAVLVYRLTRTAGGASGAGGAARLLLWSIVAAGVGAVVLWRKGDFHPRYFFAVLPAFYLLAATAVAAMPRLLRPVALAGLVVAAAVPLAHLYADPAWQRQDYRSVIARVEATAGPADTLLLLDGPPFGMFERYRSPESPVKIVNLGSAAFAGIAADALDREVARRLEGRRHVWLATDGAASGDGRRWLSAHACPVDGQSIQYLTLERAVVRDDALYARPVLARVAATIGADGVVVAEIDPARGPSDQSDLVVSLGFAPLPERIAAGDVLPVHLLWQSGAAAGRGLSARPHKVSARLIDGAGRIVSQVDRTPVQGTRPTTGWRPDMPVRDCYGLLVPVETPAGAYRVQVVLYDEETLVPLFEYTHAVPIAVAAPATASTGGAPTGGAAP